MAPAVVAFTPELLPLVKEFALNVLSRPTSPGFYRWRYLESLAFSNLYLGIEEGQCVAMIAGLRKTYLIGSRPTPCIEVFDWHCVPHHRGSGIGIRVMRAMMRLGDRVIAIGGTPDVLGALPAMGWRRLADARTFALPTSARLLAAALREKTPGVLGVLAGPLAVAGQSWFRPRRRAAPADGTVSLLPTVSEQVNGLYTGHIDYDFVQVPQADVLNWAIGGWPGAGSFTFLRFFVGDSLRGWALTRVYESNLGREAALTDVFAPRPSVELYTWMVSEALMSVAPLQPMMVSARTTCPLLRAALRANRFREDAIEIPVHTWPPEIDGPPDRVHITLNHTDAPWQPYVLRDGRPA